MAETLWQDDEKVISPSYYRVTASFISVPLRFHRRSFNIVVLVFIF